MVLSLSFLFGGVASWKWVMGVGVTDETCLVFSESVSLFSKLRALLLCMSFVVSSNMLESLRHCLVSLPVTMVSLFLSLSPSLLVCGRPGKVMASRLAWLSLSLACHSVPLPPGVPDGEKGQGRPTDAARVEVLLARCRSLFLCRSLRVTGVWEEAGSRIRTQGRIRERIQRGVKVQEENHGPMIQERKN